MALLPTEHKLAGGSGGTRLLCGDTPRIEEKVADGDGCAEWAAELKGIIMETTT